MRTQYDLSKAGAIVDEYAAAIVDPNQLPSKHNRTWLEFCMQRNGLISDVRKLAFGEAQALWYACLVVTGRVHQISRLEKRMRHAPADGRSTERTIRAALSERYSPTRDTHTARMLREIVANVDHP